MTEGKRWRVVASYRSSFGPVVPVEWFIDELDELPPLIEHGPSWDALVDVRVSLARPFDFTAAVDREGNVI